MADVNDMELLREFDRTGSEEAFAQLVKRHVSLVYSVALRHTGMPAHAEEITQVVFVILARKAGRLRAGTILEGWLHETARLTALDFLRRERRRQAREQEACMESILQNQPDHAAWEHLAPLLDEAIAQLGGKDRDAVMLRFFKGNSVREVAEALGINENAAQQRILRAVEKMRLFFARRGVAVQTTAITAAISANSVEAAPVALAQSVTAFAMANGAGGSASTLTLIKGAMKIMAWSKIQTGVVGAVAAVAFVVPLAVQHESQAKLADGAATFRRQGEQLTQLRADNTRLSQQAAGVTLSHNQLDDLRRLQSEVGTLRQQTNEVAKLQDENRRLRARNGLDRPKPAGQIVAEARAKMMYQRQWLIEFFQYAEKHDGQFPASFDDVGPGVADNIVYHDTVSTNQFDIVYHGTQASLTNPPGTILLREKEAWNAGASSHPTNQWAKIYGFADGHVEVHHEMQNNFDDYERQHIIDPAATAQ